MAISKGTTAVEFGRGLRTNYDSSKSGMIYFATDTKEILINNVVYGISTTDLGKLSGVYDLAISEITYDETTAKFTVSYVDGAQATEFSIPTADKSTPGLMTEDHVENLNELTTAVGMLIGNENVAGSVKNAIKESKNYTDSKLDAQYVKFTTAAASSNFDEAVETVDAALNDVAERVVSLEGLVGGSVSDQIDTKIEEVVGTVSEGKTVVDMISESKAEAKTEIAPKTTGHITITSDTADDGHTVYTFNENNIADAGKLDTLETSVGSTEDEANASGSVYARIAALAAEDGNLDSRLDALEDSESGALASAKKYTDEKINSLNPGDVVGDGDHVDVTVTQKNGVITSVTISETDIASAEILAEVKAQVDSFFADDAKVEGVVDTLVEIQTYIDNNGGQAADLVSSIQKAQEAADKAQGEVDALEGVVGTGFTESSTVSSQLAAVKATADGAVQEVKEGTANGTISVDGTNVSVHGLSGAAYKAEGYYEVAGTAQSLIDALSDTKEDTEGLVKVTVSTSKGNVSSVVVDDSLVASATSVSNEVLRATTAENTIEASVGLNTDGSHITTTGNYTSKATTIAGEIAALDAQVKINSDALTWYEG